jgi:hypothetical protein
MPWFQINRMLDSTSLPIASEHIAWESASQAAEAYRKTAFAARCVVAISVSPTGVLSGGWFRAGVADGHRSADP